MSDKQKQLVELDTPQYNSTLKLIKKLDDLNSKKEKGQIIMDEVQVQEINEEASVKLNLRGKVYDGLVAVEPDQEDFLRFLESKNPEKFKNKAQTNSMKNSQKAPDLMEFYPEDLIKEFPEVEIETTKPIKLTAAKASMSLADDPKEKYFKWN